MNQYINHMPSIENLYWILVVNLLKPVGLDCWYYYPFGTQQNLYMDQFNPLVPKKEHHVLFYFDQEPLWNDNLPVYDDRKSVWSDKIIKVMANSEHSDMKKKVCKQRKMLDWYFFYHGFAALHWYRDARHVDSDHVIQNAFLSLNHLTSHRRSYRISLLARLLDRGVAHKGSISFHADLRDVMAELASMHTQISAESCYLIERHFDSTLRLPWQLDRVISDGNLSARFGHNELRLWQSSLWHIVNETVFYESKLHLTEKIFQPIVAKRPFILAAAPGNLSYLRRYGFQTFDRWIDESYDDIQDPDQRLDAITSEIARFAVMDQDELQNIQKNMMSVLDYNKQHFFGKFREIIVSELVDNFDQCIRIWNNGRVDGRELALHPDLESVKQILLR